MMGERTVAQEALFYSFSLERHVPADHLLRSIDRFVDLSRIRDEFKPFYSETGRPSIDPEMMIRMLIIGYCMCIRSERRLCDEVHLNLAYRWFCRLGLDGGVPDQSTFSKTVEAAVRCAAVPRVVALSSVGAGENHGTGWIAMNRSLEQALGRLPMPVAFLRAAYFMENWQPMIQHAASEGILRSFLAPPQRPIPMVAISDIGSIAASVLLQEWHGQQIIDLAGPAEYSPMDVASCLSHQLGRGIDTISVPEGKWTAALAGASFSDAALAGFVEMTRGLNSGHIAFDESAATERLSGDTPLDQAIGTMAFDR